MVRTRLAQLVAAADLMVKEYPNLNRDDAKISIDALMKYAFNDLTKTQGWGSMDPAVWQEQINLHDELKQFSKRVPKVDEVMTLDVLRATESARPKIG